MKDGHVKDVAKDLVQDLAEKVFGVLSLGRKGWMVAWEGGAVQ